MRNVCPWSGRFGVRHVGEWKDNDWQGDTSQTIIYKGFTTADVSVRYRFDKKQSIIANIENLSDKFYAEKGAVIPCLDVTARSPIATTSNFNIALTGACSRS